MNDAQPPFLRIKASDGEAYGKTERFCIDGTAPDELYYTGWSGETCQKEEAAWQEVIAWHVPRREYISHSI